MVHRLVVLFAVSTMLGACSDGNGPTGGDAAMPCLDDIECIDGVFCNGRERCEPESAVADARGCLPAAVLPCPDGVGCNEELGTCGASCSVDPDQDGDGHESVLCGGNDCDDFDATRYPGNPEVCDAEGHDEDCDPTTLGDDEDGDGYIAAECCNIGSDGRLACGGDCDDALSGVNPGTPETCNEVDDDCNGLVDDGLNQPFFEDADGDGFGVEESVVRGCRRPEGYAFFPGDCDDENPMTSPVGVEFCDGVDSNCSSGGGADPSEDADGDGFAPPEADHCIPLEAELDCEDGDARAFPGQTQFFAVPICDTGRQPCRCSRTLTCHPLTTTEVRLAYVCIPSGDSCAAESTECSSYGDETEARFDFDCDGVALRTPNVDAGDCSSQDVGSCSDASGYEWSTGCNPTRCGDRARRITCTRLPSACSAGLTPNAILPCR